MSNFNYQKWINSRNSKNSNTPKIENNNTLDFENYISAAANPANSANPMLRISKNSRISNSKEAEMKKYGDFTATQLKQFLGEDWELYKDNAKALTGWADLLSERKQMERGEIPKDFTAITHCASCGDVFVPPAIANNGSVLGCPWCLNKAKGLPIPSAKSKESKV